MWAGCWGLILGRVLQLLQLLQALMPQQPSVPPHSLPAPALRSVVSGGVGSVGRAVCFVVLFPIRVWRVRAVPSRVLESRERDAQRNHRLQVRQQP